VITVDQEFHILTWSRRSEDLWGLRSEETRGKHLLSLDIGLPVEQLKAPLRSCLNGDEELQSLPLEATNRRGKSIKVLVTVTPLHDGKASVRGALIMIEET
jgi:two-component system CheB/CheR fusion protein